MKLAAVIATILGCCLMFFVKRNTKAALLVMGAMTLTLVELPGVPLQKANLLLQVSFLISEWRYLPWHIRQLHRTKYLRNLLLLVSCSTLLAALTSPYVQIWNFLKTELLFKYFALAYAFWAVNDEPSLKPVLRLSFCCLIVLTVLGIMNYQSRSAEFVNALTEGKSSLVYEDVALGDIYTNKTRFRVQSMFHYAFDYGYICAAFLMLHLYAWHRKLEKSIPFLIALGCCLFGIVTCDCRTVWLCCIISVILFYIWFLPFIKIIFAGILISLAIVFSYSSTDIVKEKADRFTDIFKTNTGTSGSSIQMRLGQLHMTMNYMREHELLGQGDGFFSEGKSKDINAFQGLQGMESILFKYLLERGYIGLFLWIIFYMSLFGVFRRNRKRQPILSGLGASLVTTYLIFAIGTGELGSVYPTMLLLGMILKVIEKTSDEPVS